MVKGKLYRGEEGVCKLDSSERGGGEVGSTGSKCGEAMTWVDNI